MKKIVVLSGAGISAESGIKTFRDSNGLWENHKIEDVASPEGFARNPKLVLEFYNLRRRQLSEVNPNEAHYILAELQKDFDVHIITQNVDDLHERAGSENIIHLHGELKKVRPVNDEESIVWFGEMVPEIENAATIASTADILLVIGTSLQVYPAASLLHYVPAGCEIFVIDPHLSQKVTNEKNFFKTSATEGMKLFREAIYKR